MKKYLALVIPALVAACSAAPTDTATDQQNVDQVDPSVGLTIETGLDELELGGFGDEQRAEAARDAMDLVKARLGNPEDAAILKPADVANALTAGQRNLDAVNHSLASQGVDPVSNLLPAGFFIILGGGGTYAAGLGGGGNTGIFVVCLPRRIERLYQRPSGELRYEHYWRFKWGVTGYAGGHVTFGAGTGGHANIGLGAIWLPMSSPSQMKGGFYGGSIAIASPAAGVDLKAGVLIRDDGETNILGLVEYEGGAIAEAGLHITAMRLFDGKSVAGAIADQFREWTGGNSTTNGPTHATDAPMSPAPAAPPAAPAPPAAAPMMPAAPATP